MNWTKRLGIIVPFAFAATLNILMVVPGERHLYREHLTGYGFLFATPWAWIIDHAWVVDGLQRLFGRFAGYLIVLWIPATLYAVCLWLLYVGIGTGMASRSRT